MKLEELTEAQKANLEKMIVRGTGKLKLTKVKAPKISKEEMFGMLENTQNAKSQAEQVDKPKKVFTAADFM